MLYILLKIYTVIDKFGILIARARIEQNFAGNFAVAQREEEKQEERETERERYRSSVRDTKLFKGHGDQRSDGRTNHRDFLFLVPNEIFRRRPQTESNYGTLKAAQRGAARGVATAARYETQKMRRPHGRL